MSDAASRVSAFALLNIMAFIVGFLVGDILSEPMRKIVFVSVSSTGLFFIFVLIYEALRNKTR